MRGGLTRRALESFVDGGRLIRVRRGVFAAPGLPPDLLASARVGGPATCATALRALGAWTWPDDRLHVALPRGAHRTGPASPSTRIHWRRRDADRMCLVVEPARAILDLIACHGPVAGAAAADSLLRSRPGFAIDLEELRLLAPASAKTVLARVDGVCESGIETVLWHRLTEMRLPVQRQVVIDGVGRVDFLVGDRLVIEVDGRSHHLGAEFESDRDRDAELGRRGRRVLRFSYLQIMTRLDQVEAAVRAAVRRRDHR